MIIQRPVTAAATLSIAASSSQTCNDIHNCRTLSNIIYNSFSTMFLCTWVALHLDVPKNPWRPWWKRLIIRTGWMLIALLAPEVVLMAAFNEWMKCCFHLEEKLKTDPTCGWTEIHAMLAQMGGLQLVSEDGSKHVERDLREVPNVVDMPKQEEILDKGKGDNILKALTIIQTLWFAIQAMHRVYKGLIVTELEFTALGHVLLNIFTYWCWWNKPLNIRFPIDVYPTKKGNRQDKPSDGNTARLSVRLRLGAYLYNQDPDNRAMPQNVSILASMCFFVGQSMIVGLFGAIHCLAWNSIFSSHIEQTLWRVSALIVTAIPILILAMLPVRVLQDLVNIVLTLVTFIYIIARICLFVLALIALRHLPYEAYETTSWTAYVPHIG